MSLDAKIGLDNLSRNEDRPRYRVGSPREVFALEQVKLGLAELEFRDQLLVFLEWALGIRQGELGRCAGCRATSTTRASASNTRLTGVEAET